MRTLYFAIVTENVQEVKKISYTGTSDSTVDNLYGATLDYTTHTTKKAAEKSLSRMVAEAQAYGAI